MFSLSYFFLWLLGFVTHLCMSLIQSLRHLPLHRHPFVHPDHRRSILRRSADFRHPGLHARHTSDCVRDSRHHSGRLDVRGPAYHCGGGRGHSGDGRRHDQRGRRRGRDQRRSGRQLCDPGGLHAGQRRQQQQQRVGSWQQSELLTHRPRLSGHCEYYRGRGE